MKAALAERRRIARTFLMMGELSYEKIAKGTELPIEEIERLAGKEDKDKKWYYFLWGVGENEYGNSSGKEK